MMAGRNPKLEVFEAGIAALSCADADFVAGVMEKISSPGYTPEHIRDRLLWGHTHNNGKPVPAEYLSLAGFRSAGSVYDDRLLAEWREFLSAVLSYEIGVVARANRLATEAARA